MAEQDDKEEMIWLERCRAGDNSALVKLFNRHAESVARFLARRLNNRDAFEIIASLVSSTFTTLQTTNSPVKFNVRAFIHGIAYNELRHHYRKMSLENQHNVVLLRNAEDIALSAGRDEDLDLEVVVGQNQEKRLVRKALRRLELDDQVLLELYYWKECSRAEIAAVIGETLGMIAHRLRSAKSRLTLKYNELRVAEQHYIRQDTSKSHDVWCDELAHHLEKMRGKKKVNG